MCKLKSRIKGLLFHWLTFAVLLSTGAAAQNFAIPRDVINIAGGIVSSTSYQAEMAVGQPTPVGYAQSANYALSGGFLPAAPSVLTGTVIGEVLCPANPPQGCPITAKMRIIMSGMPAPDNLLGNFTGSLAYDPALLNYTGNSGLLSGLVGVVNDTAAGLITIAAASPVGLGDTVDVLNLNFEVIGSPGAVSTLDLEFSAMIAAFTTTDLLPYLTIRDGEFTINQPVLLGDVTGDNTANSTDALVILSYDAGLSIPPEFEARIIAGLGDINADSFTNSTDGLIVLSYDAGIPVPFPVGQPFCTPAQPIASNPGKSTIRPAKEGERIIASALPANSQVVPGQSIDIPLTIDLSSLPEKLGSYTVTVEWNPAALQYVSCSGGSTEGFEAPVVNDAGIENGKLTIAHAYPQGAKGVVNIFNARFKVLESSEAETAVSLSFSALAAAETFTDLLTYLKVKENELSFTTEDIPATYGLENYPNPFNPATEIRYQLPQAGLVQIVVYNVLGQKVQTLVNEKQQPGSYRVRWEGKNQQGQPVPSGMYFLRMKAGKFTADRKLLLLK